TTSNSCSLVDLESGKALAEIPVGEHPIDVAVSSDGTRAVVTNWLSDSVSVLRVSESGIASEGTIPVGDEPRGIALSRDGRRAFVALEGEDAVAVVDLQEKKVVARA